MPPFHRARERLEADIIGAAVPAEGNELIIALYLAASFQRFISCLHTAAGRARVFERIMYEGILPGRIRISEGRYLQTSRCAGYYRMILRVKSPQNISDRNRAAAPCAHSVPGSKTFLPIHRFFKIICHCFFASLLSYSSRSDR